MKTLITLLLLGLTTSVFCSGSRKIACTSESGVNYSHDNGKLEIQLESL